MESFLRDRNIDVSSFEVVFDIGSRDAIEAIELARIFPTAHVIAIECNPEAIDLCKQRIRDHKRIQLVNKAIYSHTGRCKFYPIDPSTTRTPWIDGNIGASSLFLANGSYPYEKYGQREIEVECIRLDDLCHQLGLSKIDMIWMDLQGAELIALQSASSYLDKTRLIHTEVSYQPAYTGQCLFYDLNTFLMLKGFRTCTPIRGHMWQDDVIFENVNM